MNISRAALIQWIEDHAHEMQANDPATIVLVEARRLLKQDGETFIDDTGNEWSRPTAWAYFAVCRALRDKHDLECRVTALEKSFDPRFADIDAYFEAAYDVAHLIKTLEEDNFECEAGPLKNRVEWQKLKKLAGAK